MCFALFTLQIYIILLEIITLSGIYYITGFYKPSDSSVTQKVFGSYSLVKDFFKQKKNCYNSIVELWIFVCGCCKWYVLMAHACTLLFVTEDTACTVRRCWAAPLKPVTSTSLSTPCEHLIWLLQHHTPNTTEENVSVIVYWLCFLNNASAN